MRDTERERQRHRQKEKLAPCRKHDVGLDPSTPGSRPEPKADTLNSYTTQAFLTYGHLKEILLPEVRNHSNPASTSFPYKSSKKNLS